jgi:hypothetical protein
VLQAGTLKLKWNHAPGKLLFAGGLRITLPTALERLPRIAECARRDDAASSAARPTATCHSPANLRGLRRKHDAFLYCVECQRVASGSAPGGGTMQILIVEGTVAGEVGARYTASPSPFRSA